MLKKPECSSRLFRSINSLLQIPLLLLNRLISYNSRCQHTSQLSWPKSSISIADLQSSSSTCEKKTESTDLNSLDCIIWQLRFWLQYQYSCTYFHSFMILYRHPHRWNFIEWFVGYSPKASGSRGARHSDEQWRLLQSKESINFPRHLSRREYLHIYIFILYIFMYTLLEMHRFQLDSSQLQLPAIRFYSALASFTICRSENL